MIMWEHFSQHLETVNIAFYTSKEHINDIQVGYSWDTHWKVISSTTVCNQIHNRETHVTKLCTTGSPLTSMGPESETTIPLICFADAANATFGTN